MSDILEKLQAIASKIDKNSVNVLTEEATKNAFILPFISLLGYDVFDPSEVVPEFVADVGIKKGEKVDYAIMRGTELVMLIECKHHGAKLEFTHASQLYRYFACTKCRIALLTNGVEYRFFSDLDELNKMDAKPFLILDLSDLREDLVPELKKLSKESFDLEEVLNVANELKYTREIVSLLKVQIDNPSDDFIKFCASGIGVGRLKPGFKEKFAGLVSQSLKDFVSETFSQRLKLALGASSSVSLKETQSKEPAKNQPTEAEIITTAEEMEGYFAVKSCLHGILDLKRVVHRDQKSYFGILLDDNNRKPIARLHFNGRTKYLGVFDQDKNETRHPIITVDDIYGYADTLRRTAQYYLSSGE